MHTPRFLLASLGILTGSIIAAEAPAAKPAAKPADPAAAKPAPPKRVDPVLPTPTEPASDAINWASALDAVGEDAELLIEIVHRAFQIATDRHSAPFTARLQIIRIGKTRDD